MARGVWSSVFVIVVYAVWWHIEPAAPQPPAPDTASHPGLRDGRPEGDFLAVFAARLVSASAARVARDAFVFGVAFGGEARMPCTF